MPTNESRYWEPRDITELVDVDFCPSCGWKDLRESMQRGFWDGLLDILQLTPIRCNSCNHRFFRFRERWAKVVIPLALIVVLFGGAAVTVKAIPWAREVKRKLTSLPAPPPPPSVIKVVPDLGKN